MAAPLSGLLNYLQSGYGTLSPEMYQHFGGDDILTQVQKFDPNAHWTDDDGGKRLDYDPSKLPKANGLEAYTLKPGNWGEKGTARGAAFDDANYGNVIDSKYVNMKNDPLWTKIAPLLVSIAAPAAGAALAGMGIGGTAGLTAAATGSGLGGGSSLPSWLTSQLAKAPTYAGQVANGGDPRSMLMNAALGQGVGMAGNALGIDPSTLKTALTLGQLARKR